MKSEMLTNLAGRREWALIFDPDDDVMEKLQQFAKRNEYLKTSEKE
jgi:hypothetical protein